MEIVHGSDPELNDEFLARVPWAQPTATGNEGINEIGPIVTEKKTRHAPAS
jgi:hypothetical protein